MVPVLLLLFRSRCTLDARSGKHAQEIGQCFPLYSHRALQGFSDYTKTVGNHF